MGWMVDGWVDGWVGGWMDGWVGGPDPVNFLHKGNAGVRYRSHAVKAAHPLPLLAHPPAARAVLVGRQELVEVLHGVLV